MGRLLQGEPLKERAKELGVSTRFHMWTQDGHPTSMAAKEPELQRRVMEAERHIRDARLWWIALISALASLLSAIAAWCAVLFRSSTP